MNKDTEEIIWKYMRDIGTCMMVTHDGALIRARPMRALPRPPQGAIWLITDIATQVDEEVQSNPSVCLTFSDVKLNTYVSVTGNIQIIREPEAAEEIWNDEADSYFVGGTSDPNAVYLKFTPISGQYWDSPSSSIVIAIKFIAAKLTGERPNVGESGKAQFATHAGTSPITGR